MSKPECDMRNDVHATQTNAEAEWARTFDAVPDLIALIDTHHRIIRVNKAMAERLGVSPEQAVGCHCHEAVHGLSEPPDFCPHKKLLANGTDERAEIFEKRLGGTFDVSVAPLKDAKGQLLGCVHVARDITERKKAEQSLKDSEAWAKTIFDSVQTGIVVIDAEGHRIVDVNPVAASMFGAPRSEIIGKVCHKFICPADVGKCPVTDLGQTVSNAEKCLIDSSGACKPIMKSVTRVSIGGRDMIIDSFIDITKRKEAEEAFARANAGLEARVKQANVISKALTEDIGNQRAYGIIYESGWKVGIEEARRLRSSWRGDASGFAEDTLKRMCKSISFEVNLMDFDTERRYARATLFPSKCNLNECGVSGAEMAYAHGYVAAVLSLSLGTPLGLKECPQSCGNISQSYDVETRPLEPYEMAVFSVE